MSEGIYEGGCFCGAIRYRARGDTVCVTHCHCNHCRQTSGASFVTWVEFPLDAFEILQGEPGRFVSRPGATRTFCRDCGTPITFHDDAHPGMIDVTVGSLDEPERMLPEDHVWATRELSWLKLDDGLPRYDTRRDD